MNQMKTEKPQGHILVVDDNRLNRVKLVHILRERGHQTTEAENGREALSALEKDTFSLMLLDIVMPEMDGFQVLQQIQAENKVLDLPVIVISAQDEIENAVRCIEMGAEDYLIKPFDTVLLTARINAALEKKRLRDLEQAHLQQIQIERQRLEEYTQELQARNEELDAFAHTVAHDLKNPLSTIVGYAELLERLYAPKLDERGGQQLKHIQNAGIKMGHIIEALLRLAGIRKETISLTPLNMACIMEETQNRLALLIQESGAEITLPTEWPVAQGYAPWVEEVWANYISNAIKYGGEPPRLTLGANALPGQQIRFWVRDNGRGIAVEDRARLFAPFERLDQIDIEGHGLGLSIVRRIVKKLGGDVGVEGEVGQGCTFFFTLPAGETAVT
jgi:two-component system, sensor histidine kinase and response regulator